MASIGQILAAIGQPIAAIGQCLWVPLRRQISYIKNLEKNFEKLEGKAKDLYSKREDVNREVNRDTISTMPTDGCQDWLEKVGEMENKINTIEAEFQESKRCIGGLCPDIWWRKKLGKKIVKMIDDEIVDLFKDHSMFSGRYVVEVPPQSVEPIPALAMEGNTSINRTIQKILRCIRDDDKHKIGIWGMGGVGKTTTMKVLNNSPEITGMFQMVIWVTVSKDGGGDIRKVQKDILKRLSLQFDDDESVERTARRIFQRLRNMKYLLLLDDLWERMDLEIIGIPNPSRENGCKMIITTRSMVVCNKMEIDEAIKVEVLSEEEAWNLFRKKVGNVVDLSEDIGEIATQVVRKCQGLPLAIIVIGGSLRNKNDPREWRNAWKELSSNKYEIIDDMEESVFKILKFSYDRIKSSNIKKCFLYCALYPEDNEILEKELVQRWLAEGFIDDDGRFFLRLDEAYDKGHAILNYLKDVSLLEGVLVDIVDDHFGKKLAAVKMHDVIRDLALIITSSSSLMSAKLLMVPAAVEEEDGNHDQFLVRTNMGGGIQDELSISNEENLGQFQRISLMGNNKCRIINLPENPRSLSLVTLFLQHNRRSLTRIPESFFEHMHKLRVLDLSDTDIRELPSSVSNLVSLRGLFLLDCLSLVTLPSQIGNLKKLQVLHLGGRYGMFEYLPIEIQQLTLFRSLRVSFYSIPSGNRLMVPNGIISRLSLLENLSICVADPSPKFGESIAEEVGTLKQLTQLEFKFTTLESFEHFLRESYPWKNQSLKSFQLTVHCRTESGYSLFDYEGEEEEASSNNRYLQVVGGNYTPTAIAEVLHRANGFHLGTNHTCQGLLDFGLKNLTQLKRCYVDRCKIMEIIIKINGNHNDLTTTTSTTTTTTTPCAVLPNLEYLDIRDMPTTRAIWEGPMPPGSFSRLATLNIISCPNLREVFTRGILQQLSNLEQLYVCDCDTVQVIIVNEEVEEAEEEKGHDNDDDVALFPKLKTLYLSDLPRLERIWKTVSFHPMAPSLETITVIQCPNLKSLHPLSLGLIQQQQNGSLISTTLIRKIEGSTRWWESLEWDHDEIKQLLPQPFFVHLPLLEG
ncbi:disease resistance protein At4g27190-like [Telopea speciosissima]|uniref:disease resistance protein At4g27190-like n=1 Tax=Telopea speciosissima TaxID=54955 RepID=UPI001CC73C92|nr:disease resistance protein At4g27190-like [Telopea speciosissima]